MSTGIWGIGVSSLSAAQLGLLTTDHNIANANTPGYSRQQTVQATNIALNTGAGSIGQGVHVQTIERMYDRFLTGQINTAQSQVSSLGSYYDQLQQIDNMLADSNAGLSPALQDFFSGVQQVASDPSSLPARQSMISSAQTMVERFHNLDATLSNLTSQVNGKITDDVNQINSYAGQIADLNQRIVVSQSSYGQPPNDLLDQRDQLINDLNKLIGVQTTTNGDGSFNVFIGKGQQLVVGGTAMEMSAVASGADPTKMAVGLKTAAGTQELPDSLIQGGDLGGLITFRNEALDPVANELGRVAASLALTFNAQHSLGQDLLGNVSGDTGFVGNFFTLSSPKVTPNALNSGSGALSVSFAAPNAPSAPDYSGNFSTDLVASNYQVKFGAGGSYTVTRLSDNQTVASGTGTGPVTFLDPPSRNNDGLSLTITAVGNSGDKFEIDPLNEIARNIGVDTRIAADPRLVAAGSPVTTSQGIANTGSMTISQGVVGVGYSLSGLPLSLTATSTTLNGVSGTWTASYSDGSTSTSTGNIPLTSGTATLSGVSFSGMSFAISGTPASGDTFTVEQNSGSVQDGRNAILFAALQTQNTVAGGTASYQSAYASMVAENGIRTRDAKIQSDAQTAVLNQAQATRDSFSGVNLDEEAANMLKYQQAYQASSKILQVGSTLFDTILSLGQ